MMFIKKQVQIIQKEDMIAANLAQKYLDNKAASLELKKLRVSLKDLMEYLNKSIKSESNDMTDDSTHGLNSYIEAINLHLDILKEVLTKSDYSRIVKGMKLIKATLHFHPTKYSYWSFVKAWFLEWIYFI